MKARTKVKTKKSVVLELSVDEAQYLHALLSNPKFVADAAGWRKDDEEWENAIDCFTDIYDVLDAELFKNLIIP